MSTVPHSMEPVHFSSQTIYCGDCVDILSQFPPNAVDLIYIDPPFNSNRNYEVFWDDTQEKRAFDDRFGDAMAYIHYMRPRIEQLYRVLKPTGSFFYHCDWHASHYIKVMLDSVQLPEVAPGLALFAANDFQNEIVWRRQNAHSDAKKRLPILSDSIFYYSKSKQFTFHPVVLPHDDAYIAAKYAQVDEDGRAYTLSDMASPQPRPNMMYEYKGYPCPPKGWRYSLETMKRLDEEGRIWFPADKAKRPRLKRFLDEQEGLYLGNVWVDIPPINSQAKERLGYPTQKPLALLRRIIEMASNPGDIVLDAFCGCGTALVAAQQLGRRWLGIDISPTSVNVMGARLEEVCAMVQAPPTMGTREVEDSWNAAGQVEVEKFKAAERKKKGYTGVIRLPGTAFYRFSNLPRNAEQLRLLPPFEFENWAVLQLGEVLRHKGHTVFAQTNRSKVGDLGLDGKIYLADRASLPHRQGESIFGERQNYLPVQVKHTQNEKSKIGRPVIDSFSHALDRDKRPSGFVIGWEFTKDAYAEIERVRKEKEQYIFAVTVEKLMAETFDVELLAAMGKLDMSRDR